MKQKDFVAIQVSIFKIIKIRANNRQTYFSVSLENFKNENWNSQFYFYLSIPLSKEYAVQEHVPTFTH